VPAASLFYLGVAELNRSFYEDECIYVIFRHFIKTTFVQQAVLGQVKFMSAIPSL
jgi:hypothetical protein